LREPISRAVAVAIALAVVGLVVLESGETLVGPGVGDALVLLGSLCAAAYTIVARGLEPDDDPMSVTAVQFTMASAVVLPVALVAWTSGAESVPTQVEPRFVLAAALVGIMGFAGSFVLYNYAIATVEAAPAAVIINLIPAVGLGTAVTLLGEPLTMYAVVGALLICASVAIFGTLEALTSLEPDGLLEPAEAFGETVNQPAEALGAATGAWGSPADVGLDLRLTVLLEDVELPELSRTAVRAN
jgi:drug/metabolite transporter (DMT)-like permease